MLASYARVSAADTLSSLGSSCSIAVAASKANAFVTPIPTLSENYIAARPLLFCAK